MRFYSTYSASSVCFLWLFCLSNFVLGQSPTAPEFSSFPRINPNTGRAYETQTANAPIVRSHYQPTGRNAPNPQPQQLPRTRAEQIAAASNYPTEENGFQQSPENLREIQQEMMELLKQDMEKRQRYDNPNRVRQDISGYIAARNTIVDMLQGGRALSVKDAYYAAEQAHGDLHLAYEEYNRLIEENVDFIRQWLTENGLNRNNPEALHYGIQQFMTDTLTITVNDPEQGGSTTLTHHPYFYDYTDYDATEDRRNYFVTKTLATGTGQCHTLPVTYLILAEALGVDVYLSYNPQHSFVRFQNNSGMWINYETTIGQFIPDQFYLDEMPMMAVAHQNGLYVQDLNRKQVVATVLLDLAVSFIDEHWVADKRFIQSCADTAMTQFPNQRFINTAGHYINRKMFSAQFNDAALRYNITHFDQVKQYPEVQSSYDLLQEYLAEVQRLGVNAYPEAEYLEMISYHDEKGRLQQSKKIDTKSKKSLFANY